MNASSLRHRFRILLISSIAALAPMGVSGDESQLTARLSLSSEIDPTTMYLYMSRDFNRRSELVESIIDYAKGYLGKPYRRGSKGPSSFDCSGFTSFVFKNFDISLSSSSSSQYHQGTGIDITEVQPGDLLFFGGRRGSSSVGHVGMAVSVDDNGTVTFIHAATSGGIRYDRYPDGGYYSARYISSRRVIE